LISCNTQLIIYSLFLFSFNTVLVSIYLYTLSLHDALPILLSKAEKRRHEKVKVLGKPSEAPNPDISSKIQAISAWLHEENKRFKQTEREKREKRLHDLQNG